MRAAFGALFGCAMAVATVSSQRAGAEYPFDDLPPLPPLPGVQTAAYFEDPATLRDRSRVVPATFEDGFTNEFTPRPRGLDDGYDIDPYGDAPTTQRVLNTTRRILRRANPFVADDSNQPGWTDADAEYGAEYGSVDGGYDPVDDEYGPLDGGSEFDQPPSFDRVFAPGPPIWVGHIASTYMPGTDRFIWNGEWFAPLWQDGRNLWFFNMRGQVDNDDAGEFNIGTGFRTLAWPGWVFGTYIYYDRLHSANDNGFSQATLGVEAMDVFWDFRFNVYFPESKAKSTSTPPSASISDGTIVVSSGIERAYWGVDFETGRLLWASGPNADHEIRGFLGLYHFDHSAAGFDSITGPRVRFEWRWYDLPWFGLGSRLTCGLTAQADTERGGDLFVFTGLRVPLGLWGRAPRRLTPLQRRMVDPVIRDVDVVTNSIGRIEPAVNSHTGEVITSVHVLDKGDDLADEIAAFDNNSVVVLDGAKGHIPSSSAIPLQPGQSVVGGGTQLDVQGALTGKKTTWTAPGTRPTIEFGEGESDGHATTAHFRPMTSGFQMADHTQLASLNIRGGRPAVAIEEAEHVYLSDIDIRDAEGAGVAIEKSQHVQLDSVSIDDVGSGTYVPKNWSSDEAGPNIFWAASIHQGSGIAGVKSSDITIRGAHIQETRQAGIKFLKSQDITIEDSVIEDTRGPGLSLHKTENVTVRNVELRDVGTYFPHVVGTYLVDQLDLHDVGMYEGQATEFPGEITPLGAVDSTAMPSTDWALKRAGIELRQTQHTRIESLTIRGAGTYGIWGHGAVDTTLDSVDISGTDHGIWFGASQDVFISAAHIKLPGIDPHWIAGGPDVGQFFAATETGDPDFQLSVVHPHHGIMLIDVTGTASIRDSHISGKSAGLGIWTQNHKVGALDLTIKNNILDGRALRLYAGGESDLTARVAANEIGSDHTSIKIDGAGTGTSSLGFFDNQLDGAFDALAFDEREMNLVLDGNQLGDGPHRIENRNDASIYLRYRNNDSPDEVVFKSMGSIFGLEPLSGNDHTPTQIGEITPVIPITVQLRAPEIFN